MKAFKCLITCACVLLLNVAPCVFAREAIKIGIVRQIDIKPFLAAAVLAFTAPSYNVGLAAGKKV